MSQRDYNDADLAYMRSLTAAVLQRSPRHLVAVLMMIALVTASSIVWMSFAQVDVVVRGSGKVIPSLQVQVVQNLEGGVVSEILVSEGDLVEVSQPLVKISDVAFASSFEENRLQYLQLRALITRLKAAAHDEPFVADPEVGREAPELMRAARSLYETQSQQLDKTLSILEEQVRQHQNAVLEASAKQRQLERSLALMREELELKKPLVNKGLVSRVEYLQLQQRENDIQGELEAVRLSIPRIQSQIEEGYQKIEQTRLDYRNTAKRELSEALSEASRIAETQQALKDRVQRTTIRSPVRGTVTRLHFNTVGGVIPAGGPILEIVPYEDTLLVEVRINPADIANISVGQRARLRFTAYDFAIYGSLEGKVQFLSADTVTSEEGMAYYVARIKPAHLYLDPDTRKLPIRVGMTTEADIITDKKTILQYVLKPINRGLERALREG